jgi:autotransporter-associated beta strand protein
LALSGLTNSTGVVNVSSGANLIVNANTTFGGLAGAGDISTQAVSGTVSLITNVATGTSKSFDGIISDNSPAKIALEKTGSGTQVLKGANSFTGGTTVTAGTLALGDGGSVGSIVGDVLNNATLKFNRSDDLNFAGNVSGSGAVTQVGSGNTTLSGTNTYSGDTDVISGTLAAGANNTVFGSGNISVNGGTLDIAGFNVTVGNLSIGAAGGNISGTTGVITNLFPTAN